MPIKPVNILVKRLAEQNKWQELEKILKGKKEFEEKGTNSFVVLFSFEDRNTPFKFKNVKILISDLNTALLLAAEKGHLETCEILLKYGFKINAIDDYQTSVFHHAVYSKNYDLCKLLKEQGAKIDTVDDLGTSPLQSATALNLPSIISLINGEQTSSTKISVKDRVKAYETRIEPTTISNEKSL